MRPIAPSRPMELRNNCALSVVVPSADAIPGEARPPTNAVMFALVVPIRAAKPGEPSPVEMSFSRLLLVHPAFPAIPMRLIDLPVGLYTRLHFCNAKFGYNPLCHSRWISIMLMDLAMNRRVVAKTSIPS